MSEILGTIDPNGREDWLLYGDPLPPSEIEVLHVMEANDPDGILIFRGVFTWTQLVDMGFVVTIDAGRLDEIP